jgi:PRTase ComF-like
MDFIQAGRETVTITQQTSLRSLRIIEKLPIDFSDDFFFHYSRLKLGVTDSVDYFGAQLSRLAKDVLTQSLPGHNDWVIAGPAYNVLPGGPNLLCSYIYEDLRNKLPDFITLSFAHLGVETDHLEIKDAESLNSYHNYSTFTPQERNRFYEHSRDPLLEQRDFRGRAVLFVNDISVTGTHQRYMEQVFAKLDVPRICWLYVLVIDRKIAEAEPEVEYAINQSSIGKFDEFADLLATDKLEYTSRCITRLLSYELSQLATLFQKLDRGRKKAILELATAEGRYSGDYFKDKMDLLKRSVA